MSNSLPNTARACNRRWRVLVLRPVAFRSHQGQLARRQCLVCRAVDEKVDERVAQKVDTATDLDVDLKGDPSRRVTISARKTGTLYVVEGQRPLSDYMTLPASQYSVLDANKIERLDAETFRCHVGGIKFLNFVLEPVLTLRVQAHPRGCDIHMLACRLDGSAVVRAQNSKFASRMRNQVRWTDGEDGRKQLVSDTFVETDLQVPGWFVLPIQTVKSTGDAVMAKVLDTAVPKFLQQLERDYQAWSSGDESRKPLGNGAL